MMTLWDAPKGVVITISSLNPGLPPLVNGRLTEMGIAQGQSLLCLRRSPFNGAVIVAIADCVYSLEKQVASQIYIQTLS